MEESPVLVIDDEESIRKIIIRIIEKVFGCLVLEAKDGQEGVELIEKKQPALVVTDFEMPEMNGEEVVRFIKERGWPIKTIVLSGNLNPEIKERALVAGCDIFMEKPFELGELIRAVEKLLGK
jgi:CheY-like chemotaxis protein